MPRNNVPVDTTGVRELDEALGGIHAGDAAVWDVEDWEAYALLAGTFAEAARRDGRRVVYFRFAGHARLVPEGAAEEVRLDLDEGFEAFLHRVREVIGASGEGAYFVFDGLSGLPADWLSDAMLGNFFALVAPAVARRDGVAWFGLLLDGHARYAVEAAKREATLFCNVYRGEGGGWLILPVKAEDRGGAGRHYMRWWNGGCATARPSPRRRDGRCPRRSSPRATRGPSSGAPRRGGRGGGGAAAGTFRRTRAPRATS